MLYGCIYVVASICSLHLSSGIFLGGPLWPYVTLVYYIVNGSNPGVSVVRIGWTSYYSDYTLH